MSITCFRNAIRTSLNLLLVILLSVPVVSQTKHSPTPKERALRLQKDLSLTKRQTADIEKIFQSTREKIDSVRRASQPDRKAAQAHIQKLMQDSDARINTILTPAQKKKVEAYKLERRKRISEQLMKKKP